jgi:hypothetical protein
MGMGIGIGIGMGMGMGAMPAEPKVGENVNKNKRP